MVCKLHTLHLFTVPSCLLYNYAYIPVSFAFYHLVTRIMYFVYSILASTLSLNYLKILRHEQFKYVFSRRFTKRYKQSFYL